MNIVSKAELFVTQLLREKLSPNYLYHNLNHTKRVVDATQILAENENVSDKDKEILLVSAWFHDVGYCQSCEKHESVGMEIAEGFLRQEQVSTYEIEKIKSLIAATSMHHIPTNELEKIIRDADASHLGSPDFFEISEGLRQECKESSNQKMSKLDWANGNLQFLKSHQFYTSFATQKWNATKQENIIKTEEIIENLNKKKEERGKDDADKSLLNKKKLEKMDSPERGIETMFRVTMNNHTRFSQIADTKANILLSVNAIIISVALSTIIPKLDSPKNVHLVYPTFIMIIFSVATVIMAILSTRPKVSGGTFTKKDIEDRKINLLFFGNFHSVSLDEYRWAMKELMKDKDYLYDSMVKDLYYLGKVLDRKYRLLRTTYTIFAVGLLITVFAFYLAFKGII